MSSMTPEKVRAWVQGFEAVAQLDRERLSRMEPQPEWSISVALSMIEAARASGRPLFDPTREASDEKVRKTWERLRARLLP